MVLEVAARMEEMAAPEIRRMPDLLAVERTIPSRVRSNLVREEAT
jgi:hypothetical protein